jgi:hypothetical protein
MMNFLTGPYFAPVAVILFFLIPLRFTEGTPRLIVAAIGLLAACLAYQQSSKYYAAMGQIDQYLAESSQYSLIDNGALPSGLWESLPLLSFPLAGEPGAPWKVYRRNSEPEAFVFVFTKSIGGLAQKSPFYYITSVVLPVKDATYDGILYLLPNWFMVSPRWPPNCPKKRKLNESYALGYSAAEPSGTLLAQLSESVTEPLRRAHGADPFVEVRSPWVLVILEGAPTKELMMAIAEIRL